MLSMATSHHDLIEELQWRGLIHDSTDLDQLSEHLTSGRRRFYIGFDPTASSLTIGNLLAMTMIIRGALAGLDAVVLLGGGTGLIGDPSGKSTERNLLSIGDARENATRHRALMTPIFQRALGEERLPRFVDNVEWLGKITILEFLRDVGKHFPVSEMIRRDSVRRRLEQAEVGMSFTEFSYSLLQSYDFARLRADHGVTVQLGASDQWGNIVAGIDYVRRTQRTQVFGLTCPLLLRADGTKFGKSEKGAIWISADRTSPYQFYQFLVNLTDEEAHKFALFFSLESREFLEKLFAEHEATPAKRALQRHIARELTTLLHGGDECDRAIAASRALFTGDVRGLDAATIEQVFAEAPSRDFDRAKLDGPGMSHVDLLTETGLASSRRQAREFLGAGAVSVNGASVGLEGAVTADDLLHGTVLLVRRGKREWRVARFA